MWLGVRKRLLVASIIQALTSFMLARTSRKCDRSSFTSITKGKALKRREQTRLLSRSNPMCFPIFNFQFATRCHTLVWQTRTNERDLTWEHVNDRSSMTSGSLGSFWTYDLDRKATPTLRTSRPETACTGCQVGRVTRRYLYSSSLRLAFFAEAA